MFQNDLNWCMRCSRPEENDAGTPLVVLSAGSWKGDEASLPTTSQLISMYNVSAWSLLSKYIGMFIPITTAFLLCCAKLYMYVRRPACQENCGM